MSVAAASRSATKTEWSAPTSTSVSPPPLPAPVLTANGQVSPWSPEPHAAAPNSESGPAPRAWSTAVGMNWGADTYTWPSPLGSNAIEGSAPDQYGCLAGSPLGSWPSGPKASDPACAAGARQARITTVRKLERWSMGPSVQLGLPAHAGLDAASSANRHSVSYGSHSADVQGPARRRRGRRGHHPPRGDQARRRSNR